VEKVCGHKPSCFDPCAVLESLVTALDGKIKNLEQLRDIERELRKEQGHE